MKKFIGSGCIILCLALVFACKKNKAAPEEDPVEIVTLPVYESYSALKTGNYWIYKEYYITNGVESETKALDSCYVSKDTLIRGNAYYKYVSSNWGTREYRRDSLRYIIDNYGKRLFSSRNFNEVINTHFMVMHNDTLNKNDTLFKLELSMSDINPLTTVPAGTFRTLDAVTKISNVHYAPATNTIYPLYNHEKYSANTGLIYSEQNFASGNTVLVKKLLRYHLE
ncbi:MAG: hypothetical protein IT236_12440 [Bacteroidia bacterium]|nr:hypothetical protein [Bacteroidia bacterium]